MVPAITKYRITVQCTVRYIPTRNGHSLKGPDPLREPAVKSGETKGRFARLDEDMRVEYPKDDEIPHSPIVQGRGGQHLKRTLASFSLEDRTSVVTGGARGLGLVMGQALIASGSNLAIVDLNSKCLF